MESRYDDNVLQSANGMSDWVQVVSPQLTVGRTGKLSTWEARARRSYEFYDRTPTPTTSTDTAVLRMSYKPSEDNALAMDYRFVRSHDPINFDQQAVLVRENARRTIGSIRVDRWQGEAAYELKTHNYESVSFGDGRFESWAAAFFPIRTREDTWLIGYRGRDLQVGDDTVLRSQIMTVGLRRSHSRLVSSELELGAALVDYPGGGPRHHRPVVVAAVKGPSEAPGVPMTGYLKIIHEEATTVEAEVTRLSNVGRVSARWDSRLDAEGGSYLGPTLTHRVSIEGRKRWAGEVTGLLEADYGRTRPFQSEGKRTEVYRVSASLSAPVRSWLTGQIDYDHLRQAASGANSPLDFHRNRLGVSLTAAWH
ncbi:MAG: hypothetical protein HY207_07510 [Nitrospirae bacterium]|nr:hypothetical protein [Nitrospirota bacterium]